MLLAVVERLALTVWVGSLWAAGYLAAPVLFMNLEPAEAGELAGQMFTIVAWVGIICGAILVFTLAWRPVRPWATHWRLWLVVAMVAMVVAGELLVRPGMGEIEAATDHFVMLHRAAEALYLLVSLFGAVLVAFGTGAHFRQPAAPPSPPQGA